VDRGPWAHGAPALHPEGYVIWGIRARSDGLEHVVEIGHPRRRFAGGERRRRCGALETTGSGREERGGDGELTRRENTGEGRCVCG
jgi:hypothetical protein